MMERKVRRNNGQKWFTINTSVNIRMVLFNNIITKYTITKIIWFLKKGWIFSLTIWPAAIIKPFQKRCNIYWEVIKCLKHTVIIINSLCHHSGKLFNMEQTWKYDKVLVFSHIEILLFLMSQQISLFIVLKFGEYESLLIEKVEH